jgi:hypothetical protein
MVEATYSNEIVPFTESEATRPAPSERSKPILGLRVAAKQAEDGDTEVPSSERGFCR